MEKLMFDVKALKGKRIAITGGAGFIGHNLALKLKSLGAEPHVIDGLQVNHLGFYTSSFNKNENSERYISFLNERLRLLRENQIDLHIIDARDYHILSSTLTHIKPDVIVHAAAIAHANRSNKDPFSTFDHSMRTLENVLDNCKTSGTHVIYFSSSMVYGNFDGETVQEDRFCSPLGIYGALKYGSEKLIIGYNQVFDLPYTIIRPSALYGERCVSRRVGQAFIENAITGRDLTINGNGEESLDFTYIDDFIQGVILTITNDKAKGEIFNITYGSARKLNDLADIVMNSFPGVNLIHNPRDDLMPERGTLSIKKAREILGYHPSFSIDVGFKKYIDWYKNFSNKNPDLFFNK